MPAGAVSSWWTVVVVLVLALAALVALGVFRVGGVGLDVAGRFDGPAALSSSAQQQLLSATKNAVPLVVSYDYRKLDQDAEAATAQGTADFDKNYNDALNKLIKPQAPTQKTVQTASVAAAAIQSVSPDGRQANVIVYGQTTISNVATGSQPRNDLLSLLVTMNLVDGRWLVQSLRAI